LRSFIGLVFSHLEENKLLIEHVKMKEQRKTWLNIAKFFLWWFIFLVGDHHASVAFKDDADTRR